MANQRQLILGGARSGKSRTAEQRVADDDGRCACLGVAW